ncbi:MAG: methionyl-tRNA formyltransferase [Alphaproteobacteria bacterium]|nr:methionyl-tRNA formyltransferase [Alphaproteobacteria bacterium]
MTARRVVFMGTPQFAVPTLQSLIASEHQVVAVYSQPPRPAGRGQKLTKSPIQQLAEQHAIPVFTPTSLKSAEEQSAFAAHHADVAVVAAYGLLLPQAVLDAPKHGCINIHPSALPRWRGAAPIQRTIMAGDTTTDCCIMQMEAGLDTGAVLAREAFAIPDHFNASDLHDTMASTGARMTIDVLAKLSSLTPTIQSGDGVTYAHKITKEDQKIDWSKPAQEIRNQIRGLYPSPVATTTIHGEVVKIFSAKVEPYNGSAKPTGIVLDDALLVQCGGGSALRILELQRPNKIRMAASDVLKSFIVQKDNQLG